MQNPSHTNKTLSQFTPSTHWGLLTACLLTWGWRWWQHPLLVWIWRETPLQLLVRGQLRLLLFYRLLLYFRPVNCFPGVTQIIPTTKLIYGAFRCFWEAETNRKICCVMKGNRKNCLQKRWYMSLCTHSLFTQNGAVVNEDLTALFTICCFHLSEHACSPSASRCLYGITLIPLLFCILLLNLSVIYSSSSSAPPILSFPVSCGL